MTGKASFDVKSRRPAIRRTVWVLVGLVALVYGSFFLRAILLS